MKGVRKTFVNTLTFTINHECVKILDGKYMEEIRRDRDGTSAGK